MVCSLQNEIARQTGAERLFLRRSDLVRWVGLGTRFERFRRLLPKASRKLPNAIDVVWHVMMGPEGSALDLLDNWRGKHRHVVYLFDTLPAQFEVIRRQFSGNDWNLRIASFEDAIPQLQQITQQPWHHVPQAVSLEYFKPAALPERVIHFSSYGRRDPRVHEAVMRFCKAHHLYYDYTTHNRKGPTAPPLELLHQYAWHLSHSIFTFCWPMEHTNAERAGYLSPLTCRWFEAAAAGAAIIGQPPKTAGFEKMFGPEAVNRLNPDADVATIIKQLELLWHRRADLSERALKLRQRLGLQLDWSQRVEEMLRLLERPLPTQHSSGQPASR